MDKPQLGFFAPIIEPGVHSKSISCFYFFTKNLCPNKRTEIFVSYLLCCRISSRFYRVWKIPVETDGYQPQCNNQCGT